MNLDFLNEILLIRANWNNKNFIMILDRNLLITQNIHHYFCKLH